MSPVCGAGQWEQLPRSGNISWIWHRLDSPLSFKWAFTGTLAVCPKSGFFRFRENRRNVGGENVTQERGEPGLQEEKLQRWREEERPSCRQLSRRRRAPEDGWQRWWSLSLGGADRRQKPASAPFLLWGGVAGDSWNVYFLSWWILSPQSDCESRMNRERWPSSLNTRKMKKVITTVLIQRHGWSVWEAARRVLLIIPFLSLQYGGVHWLLASNRLFGPPWTATCQDSVCAGFTGKDARWVVSCFSKSLLTQED